MAAIVASPVPDDGVAAGPVPAPRREQPGDVAVVLGPAPPGGAGEPGAEFLGVAVVHDVIMTPL